MYTPTGHAKYRCRPRVVRVLHVSDSSLPSSTWAFSQSRPAEPSEVYDEKAGLWACCCSPVAIVELHCPQLKLRHVARCLLRPALDKRDLPTAGKQPPATPSGSDDLQGQRAGHGRSHVTGSSLMCGYACANALGHQPLNVSRIKQQPSAEADRRKPVLANHSPDRVRGEPEHVGHVLQRQESLAAQ